MHDHAAYRDIARQADFRQVTPQEVRASGDVIQRELGAVGKLRVALLVADIARIVKQRGDERHLRAARTETLRRVDAGLVAHDQPGQCQRHVERMLDVVVGRVAAAIARVASGKQALEIVKGQP